MQHKYMRSRERLGQQNKGRNQSINMLIFNKTCGRRNQSINMLIFNKTCGRNLTTTLRPSYRKIVVANVP